MSTPQSVTQPVNLRSIQIGMLWWDDSRKRTLAQKIERAATRYEKKYGKRPTLCYANPETMGEQAYTLGALTLKPARSILPNHFWFGFAIFEAAL